MHLEFNFIIIINNILWTICVFRAFHVEVMKHFLIEFILI